MLEGFKIIGKIEDVEIIAVGRSIRIFPFLNKQFGKGHWRKLKGTATVERISNGRIRLAEIHWRENKTLAGLIMNTKYAVCLENKGYEASLQIGKLYEIVTDEKQRTTKCFGSLMKTAKIIYLNQNYSINLFCPVI